MKDTLINNIDKLHTTILGKKRIINNLKLNNINEINYIKELILNKKSIVYKKGKNYYCEIDNIRVTINSYNYCVITAHFVK